MLGRAVRQYLPGVLFRAGIPPRAAATSPSAAIVTRGNSHTRNKPAGRDHTIEYYARTALRKRECSVGDWLAIRDVLSADPAHRPGGPVPAPAISPATIADLFRLSNRRLYKGVLGNAALPAQTIQAAVDAYAEQPSGQHFSRDEISSCILNLRWVDSPDSARSLLQFLTGQLQRTVQETGGSAWRGRDVSNMIFGLNRISSVGNGKELSALLPLLAACIRNCKVLSTKELGNSVYGLRNIKIATCCEDNSASVLLEALSEKLSRIETLDSVNLSRLLYGVNEMSSSHPSVRRYLSILTEKVPDVQGSLDAQGVGNIMYGLKSMSSDHTEVEDLIKVLIPLLSQHTERLSSQELSNSMYGFQGLSSTKSVVLELVSLITKHLQYSRSILDPQGVGNSVYGLQRLCSCTPEVQELLASLSQNIAKGTGSLTTQQQSNCCYGLQRMNSDISEVRSLVKVVAHRISQSRAKRGDTFSAQAFGNSMYGLQQMDSSVPEVQRILTVLHVKLKDCTEKLQPQEVANFLYGFQRMRISDLGVANMLELLWVVLQRSNEYMENVYSPQEICNILYGVQNMPMDSANMRSLTGFVATMTTKCQLQFSAHEIGHSFYSLKSSDGRQVVALIAAMNEKLVATSDVLLPSHISGALFGLRNTSSSCSGALESVSHLTARMKMCRQDFTGAQIGQCLYALKNYDLSTQVVNDLLINVAAVLCETLPRMRMTPQQASSVLYGLRLMTDDNSAVRSILSSIVELIERNRREDGPLFTAGDIAIAVCSLQEKCVENVDVRRLLTAITREVELTLRKPDVHFTTQELGMIFYGLKSFTSDSSSEFNKFMSAVADITYAHRGGIDDQAFGNMFYGLKSMSTPHDGLSKLLNAVHSKVQLNNSDIKLSGQSLGNSLYGLQGMSSQIPEVRSILSVLAALLKNELNLDQWVISPAELGNALYGFQHINNDIPEGLLLLSSLVKGSEASDAIGAMSFSSAGMALFGIHRMTVMNEDLRVLLSSLLDRVDSLVRSCVPTEGEGSLDIGTQQQCLMLSQNLKLVAYTWDKESNKMQEHSSRVHATIDSLPAWCLPVELSSSSKKFASLTEKQVFRLFENALHGLDQIISITANSYLDVFEADIVIRFDVGEISPVVVNIEVDGPFHRKSKLFDSLRDNYLLTHRDVLSIRLPSSWYNDVSAAPAADTRRMILQILHESLTSLDETCCSGNVKSSPPGQSGRKKLLEILTGISTK